MLEYKTKDFESLGLKELYDILKLRQEVFIVEQDCPYLDADGLDLDSHHVIGRLDDEILAYTRIVPPGSSYPNYSSIGRVINAPKIRNKGEGKRLMLYSIKQCNKLFPQNGIKISAQCYLDRFYTELGFKVIGEQYLEDGIPHQGMILSLINK